MDPDFGGTQIRERAGSEPGADTQKYKQKTVKQRKISAPDWLVIRKCYTINSFNDFEIRSDAKIKKQCKNISFPVILDPGATREQLEAGLSWPGSLKAGSEPGADTQKKLEKSIKRKKIAAPYFLLIEKCCKKVFFPHILKSEAMLKTQICYKHQCFPNASGSGSDPGAAQEHCGSFWKTFCQLKEK